MPWRTSAWPSAWPTRTPGQIPAAEPARATIAASQSSSPLLSGGVPLEESGLVCQYDGLHAVAEAQLLEDVRDVCLDGRLADVELLTDLRVGQAAGDEPEDVFFPCGELVQLFRRRGTGDAGELFDHALGDRG